MEGIIQALSSMGVLGLVGAVIGFGLLFLIIKSAMSPNNQAGSSDGKNSTTTSNSSTSTNSNNTPTT